jgi:hypothetical protein
MMSRITEIAPLSTWVLTLGAALMLLCGFVAFGHAKVVNQAYKESFRGGLSPAMLETMMRWAVVFLVGGFALWGVALDWPSSILYALLGVILATLGIEALARLLGGMPGA